MSVVLPNKYEHRGKLEQRGVLCITENEANRADIRPLRVGILNIMPKGETYEPFVLYRSAVLSFKSNLFGSVCIHTTIKAVIKITLTYFTIISRTLL